MTEQTILAGRYRLEAPLGRGGMGEVWRARDERLGRAVAVKLLTAPPGAGGRIEEAAAARFRREARIAAGLRHPGIAAVHDFGADGGRLYLVIELLDGRDLNAVMRDHPGGLPHERAARLAARIAAALAAAHERGVVHRDVKPANVMVDDRDEITVLDFGIARYADAVTDLTGGAAIGTPAFMAPEQFDGRAPVDARADLYALGALMHVLLTGAPPYVADGMPSLLHAIMMTPPPSVRERRPDVPAALDGLVRDLLAKDPAGRPASAAEVIARLTGEPREPRPGVTAPVTVPATAPVAVPVTAPPADSAGTVVLPAAPGGGPAATARRSRAGRTVRAATALFATGVAAFLVALANPGDVIFDGGAFDGIPDCADVAPRGLPAVEVRATGDADSRSCVWETRNGLWTVTLSAVRIEAERFRSGPHRARDLVRRHRAAAKDAADVELGDDGFVHRFEDVRRLTEFRLSNLAVSVDVGSGGRQDAGIDEVAQLFAAEVAGKLRTMTRPGM
ncbi:serine/threonine-protein kinase pknH [Mycobacterium tuberculosis]|nr:serine/threonine-protein kinase pknH [Mycobacterium tuberculosis]